MIKCDYCDKKINSLQDIFQLDISKWDSEGVGTGCGNFGDYHKECADILIEKLKTFAKEELKK